MGSSSTTTTTTLWLLSLSSRLFGQALVLEDTVWFLLIFFFFKKKISGRELVLFDYMAQEIKWVFLFLLCIKVIVLYNISLLDFLSDVRSEMKLAWGLHICFYMVEEIILLVGWFLYLPAIP